MTGSRPVVFALGANLGDVEATLDSAHRMIAASKLVSDVEISSWYETDSVGVSGQEPYRNAIVRALSTAAPLELLGLAYWVEVAHGRTREEHWGPRTCDVDVIAIGADLLDEPGLQVPHPLAHERAFVLVPWSEVAPHDHVVGHGRVDELAASVMAANPDSVRRISP